MVVEDENMIIINDCTKRAKKLNDWENEFLVSIRRQYSLSKHLTKGQEETLHKIWEKATIT